ncbi:MAG: outer membrane beta-barrel protein [Alphaproteobacteria bacterium]
MKKFVLMAALVALCGPAFAQGADKSADKSADGNSGAVQGPVLPADKSQNLAQTPPPEHGPDRGWYVDFGGQFALMQEQTIRDGIIPGGTGELASDPGFGVTGALGYAWENGLRTEAELGYRRNGIDKVSGGAYGTRFTGDVDGHISALSGMFNMLYDYDTKSAFTPYIGSGLGLANVTAASGPLHVDDNDVVFAYQFMGGVRYALTDNISIRTGYRYFATTAPDIRGSSGEYGSHNVEMGLTFGF